MSFPHLAQQTSSKLCLKMSLLLSSQREICHVKIDFSGDFSLNSAKDTRWKRNFLVVSCCCQREKPDWISYHGYRKTQAIYRVKCPGWFLRSSWRNHGYFPRQIYLGKVHSHTLRQFPTVKGSRVTAQIIHLQYFSVSKSCKCPG